MLGSTKMLNTRQTGSRCLSTLHPAFFKEPAGPECVAPVVIAALAQNLDKSLKADQSLSS